MNNKKQPTEIKNQTASAGSEKIILELVSLFREKRENLRKQWVKQMTAKGYLEGLNSEEIKSESENIYDTCIGCLETGKYDAAQVYANRMAERGVLRGMTAEQIISGLLVLRDVYGRSLFENYHKDMVRLSSVLDIYEPVANKILSIVAIAFISEREKVVHQQQEAIRELSTPVLILRDRLLILPIIGILDSQRAKQLTEQLLRSIRSNHGKVVVIDITGVPAIDSRVANHLIQTIEAVRLLGAITIVSGVSPEIAQTVVTIGVDLSRIKTVGDLRSAIDEADKLLGYKVIMPQENSI